jgi:hypothetical protein
LRLSRALIGLGRRLGWRRTRGAVRIDCVGRYAVVHLGGEHHVVAVHDLSRAGLCVDASPGLAPGLAVEVSIDAALAPGTVRWVADGRAGIAFDQG